GMSESNPTPGTVTLPAIRHRRSPPDDTRGRRARRGCLRRIGYRLPGAVRARAGQSVTAANPDALLGKRAPSFEQPLDEEWLNQIRAIRVCADELVTIQDEAERAALLANI